MANSGRRWRVIGVLSPRADLGRRRKSLLRRSEAAGARTQDLRIKSPLLYRLSYSLKLFEMNSLRHPKQMKSRGPNHGNSTTISVKESHRGSRILNPPQSNRPNKRTVPGFPKAPCG